MNALSTQTLATQSLLSEDHLLLLCTQTFSEDLIFLL